MSEKNAKRLRKEMKKVNGFDVKKPADYRVSKTTSKIAYFKVKNQYGIEETKAIPVKRVSLVNASKIQYRRVKKAMQKRS